MQTYIIFCADHTAMYENRADAFECAWKESYNLWNEPVNIYEDIDGNSSIFATVYANRSI